MEWIIWVIVIVVIIAVVWWLLNRNSGDTAGTRDAAGTDQVTSTSPSETESAAPSQPEAAAVSGPSAAFPSGAGTTDRQPAPLSGEAPARQGSSAAGQINPEDQEPDIESWDAATPRPVAGTQGPSAGDVDDWDDEEDKAEWETQWSETGADHHTGTGPAAANRPAEPFPSAAATAAPPAARTAPATPVHHAEYTDPHAPTLPGAESAAAEALDADAETRQRMQSSAATEEGASHDAEPVGHQETAGGGDRPAFGGHDGSQPAVDAMAGQPYGDGSAAPAADGSGPDGYTVKADAGSMTYYDEDNPGYADARAEVWFLSPAHAEAAGFRAPRRTRR